MDTQNAWQSFVKTGNILSYLDYRQQDVTNAGQAQASQGEDGYGPNRNYGAGAPGNQI